MKKCPFCGNDCTIFVKEIGDRAGHYGYVPLCKTINCPAGITENPQNSKEAAELLWDTRIE